jgi:argininosuccinate lyase
VRLWGGRFEGETDEGMEALGASLEVDRRLHSVDVLGSIAYTHALRDAGVLTEAECHRIEAGLERVRDELGAETFEVAPEDEDIHTAIERRLHELIGNLAGKLHTGRSRNDQVATATRMYLLRQMPFVRLLVVGLQRAIVGQAELHLDVIMPGYTHGQPAQPVLFAHWLLSYFWMLQRDVERLDELAARVSVLPLGAGALAGNAFGIDRESLAEELGFGAISENSIDAVSDRDFIIEFLSFAALLGVHLSRLAADLVLWSSAEYGFVEIDEAYTTGSSIMPQKRNPDSLELVRGKAGRLVGNLVALLMTVKGLPSSYNRDLQEDKPPLFDSLDTLFLTLPVAAGVVGTLRVCEERMRAALGDGMLATDLAEYLVRKGVPFRQSHRTVGQVVLRAEEAGVQLRELSLQEYRMISDAFEQDLFEVFDFERSVASRDVPGGTAPAAVSNQLARARKLLGIGRKP